MAIMIFNLRAVQALAFCSALASAKVVTDDSLHDKQAVVADEKYQIHLRPSTIVVGAEASIPRVADVADLEISLAVSGADRDNVTAQANSDMEYVKSLLKNLPDMVGKWTATAVSVRDDETRVHLGCRKSSSNDDTDAKEYYANGHLSVPFKQLDMLPQFAHNVTNATKLNIDWIDWKISDATKAAAKSELMLQAMDKLMEAATEYAHLFDLGLDTLLEFREERFTSYAESGGVFRYGFGDYALGGGDGEEWQPPTMNMHMDVRGTFRVKDH